MRQCCVYACACVLVCSVGSSTWNSKLIEATDAEFDHFNTHHMNDPFVAYFAPIHRISKIATDI